VHAGSAHLGKRDLLRPGQHGPMIPPIGG
jgi:hypothetical protein